MYTAYLCPFFQYRTEISKGIWKKRIVEKHKKIGNCTRNYKPIKEIMGHMLPLNKAGKDNERRLI